ncbi:MAG: hypothetical protein QXZ70_08570 [Candidatus Bathyarchaeia archaeon]
MTFGVSAVPSIDYSGSSLRFGLLDIKPMEVIETVKRFGMKFQRITRRFELSRAPQTYSELVTFQNRIIIDSFSIPEWFDGDKLVYEFSRRAIENYEKDEEFKKAVDALKKSDRIGRPLLSFVQFVKNRFESELDLYLETEAERFLNSNFPLSFYNKFVLFDHTYHEFLGILENNVRKYEFLASCARNFIMYQKRISEMKSAISPIIDQIDACFLQYLRLKKYIIIWNSKDYSEIRNPKFLDIKKINYPEFEKLFNEYVNKLGETRHFLLDLDNVAIQKGFYSTENAAKEVFSKLVSLDQRILTAKGT